MPVMNTPSVHTGDLDTVLADHAPDIVMFDVPPPYDGVRGLDAYRETWLGFFEWQRSGASSHWSRWTSPPAKTSPSPTRYSSAALPTSTKPTRHYASAHHRPPRAGRSLDGHARAPLVPARRRTARRRLNGDPRPAHRLVRQHHHRRPGRSDGTHRRRRRLYEIDGNYVGKPAVREACKAGLDSTTDSISFTTPDIMVAASGNLAIAWGVDHVNDTDSRATRVFKHTPDG